MPREEVIATRDDRHPCVFSDARRKLLDHLTQLFRRTEAIEFACHQKLRLIAMIEIGEAAAVQIADRQAETEELRDARIAAPGTQSDPGTKTEARDKQRHGGIFRREKINHGQNIVALAGSFIVCSFAQSHSAKVEPHDGQPKSMNRFRGLVNHFVVHRPAEERMRVADKTSLGRLRVLGTFRFFQQCFERAGGAIDRMRFDAARQISWSGSW